MGQEFVNATCKRCKKPFRRMKMDKLMPICPSCEPEDTAEWLKNRKRKQSKRN